MNRQELFERIIYDYENPMKAYSRLLQEGYTKDEIPQRTFKAALKTGDRDVIRQVASNNLRSNLAEYR